MNSPLVRVEYQGSVYSFDAEGWFNATSAASRFGKKPAAWLRLPETKRYIAALCKQAKVQKSHFARATRGGAPGDAGTWFHPKLAVPFARWLDIDFSVWADAQINRLIRGQDIATLDGLYVQRLAFEARKMKSQEKGSLGGKLLNERKREKPALDAEAAAWQARMEPGLFGQISTPGAHP